MSEAGLSGLFLVGVFLGIVIGAGLMGAWKHSGKVDEQEER